MKADLYDVNKESGKRPQIYDDNITASSALGEAYAPQFARFGNNSCWRPAPFDNKAWIQVDLQGLHIITGIVVQACGPEFSDWVYEFTVQSKTANNPFVSHRDASTGMEVRFFYFCLAYIVSYTLKKLGEKKLPTLGTLEEILKLDEIGK